MKTSMLSAFAGAVLLASTAVAGAGEPVKLGSAELDAVTAGQRTAVAAVSQRLNQSNFARIDVNQRATAFFGDAVNISVVNLRQSNTADQRAAAVAAAR